MAAPKSFRSQGIVLESKPLGEADLMVTLLTSDEGKLRAMARGARKTTSKLVGHLEPLNRVDISVARGKEFQYVSQAQVLDNFLPLKTGLGGVTRGLYMAELASWYAVEEAPGSRIHDLLLDGLRFLPECKNPDIVLRCFEMQLLKVSGFMPELYCCVDCGEELSPKGHQFSPALGGTLCDRCRPSGVAVRPMSLDALKVLRFLAKTTMPEADRLRLESELAEEVSRLLSLLLSYWPDHEIRSRRFMDHVRTDAPSVISAASSVISAASSVIPAASSVIPAEAGTHGPDPAATGEPVCHTSLHQTSASSPGASSIVGSDRSAP